jgi:NADPH2 dehydrogenase
MSEDDMSRVTNAFVDSARRAVRIGFDAIELHLAHGYLLHSFVSPLSNKRNDQWGGAPAGRMRFPLEVARAVRAVVPAGTPLGARITGSDWLDGGLTGEDAAAFAKALKQEAGLNYIDVSSGNITVDSRPPTEPGYNVTLAEQVRRASALPVRTVGLIASATQAEEIVAQGKADMVAMARAFLDDPHWAWHAAGLLGADMPRPPQYLRAGPKTWPGAAWRA